MTSYSDPTVLFKWSFVCFIKKIIREAKYFCFSYTFFHKIKLSKSYICRVAVRDSYNRRDAVGNSSLFKKNIF